MVEEKKKLEENPKELSKVEPKLPVKLKEKELETEEIEEHKGEIIRRERFAHSYTVKLSEKENQSVEELEKQLNVESLKDLILKVTELLKADLNKKLVIMHLSSKEEEFLLRVQKHWRTPDLKQLLLEMAVFGKEDRCPHCNFPLILTNLCKNCGKIYIYEQEDVDQVLDQLKEEPSN